MKYVKRIFRLIDATGLGNKNDPRMRDVEAEMIRSHELCLKRHLYAGDDAACKVLWLFYE